MRPSLPAWWPPTRLRVAMRRGLGLGVRGADRAAASTTDRGTMVVGDDAVDNSAAEGPSRRDGEALDARPPLNATSSVWLPPDDRTARSGDPLLAAFCGELLPWPGGLGPALAGLRLGVDGALSGQTTTPAAAEGPVAPLTAPPGTSSARDGSACSPPTTVTWSSALGGGPLSRLPRRVSADSPEPLRS